MNKDLFKVECFEGDYFEDYKDYSFSVGLSPNGFYSAAILFPEDVSINGKYMNEKEAVCYNKFDKESLEISKKNIPADKHIVVNNNWFTDLIVNTFLTVDSDIYVVDENKNRQLIVFVGVGINRDPKCGYMLLVKEKDLIAAAKKYKRFFDDNPEARVHFNEFREFNNMVEEKVRVKDYDWISRNIRVREIYHFEQNDIIKFCREFIDNIVEHDEKDKHTIKKHKNVFDAINKVKTEKSNRRKSK